MAELRPVALKEIIINRFTARPSSSKALESFLDGRLITENKLLTLRQQNTFDTYPFYYDRHVTVTVSYETVA